MGCDHPDLGESALLESARSGSDGAYRGLRAWRGLAGFEGGSSLRSWLYKIATHAALDVAQRRSRRELPMTYGPCAGSGESPGVALLESVWVEPYPDQAFGVAGGLASPEAQYERRESLELAFVAALQYLPPLQRAVLVLREVLGFSGKETADLLDTTVPAVQSVGCRVPSVLDVLTLDGDRIAEVTGFVTAELLSRWGQEDDRFVGATAFPRFGLPASLPGEQIQRPRPIGSRAPGGQ